MSSSAELRNGRVKTIMERAEAFNCNDVELLKSMSTQRMIIGEEIDATKTGERPNVANYQRVNCNGGFLGNLEKYLSLSLTKGAIKEKVESFIEQHNEKELLVTVSLISKGKGKNPICNFYIDSESREVIESCDKECLTINISSLPKALNSDDVVIPYEEVMICEELEKVGETSNDVVAKVLEIVFKNGTVMELGFLNI